MDNLLPNHIDTVLFDLGGVLVCDPWESLLLTPDRGLADRLDLDRATVERVGHSLWRRYSLRPTSEAHYWKTLASELDVGLSSEFIAQLEAELLFANPRAKEILDRMSEQGVRIGIISDNTSFWYPKQARLIGLEPYLEPTLSFLSYVFGVHKDLEGRGLFDIAARTTNPGSTLVVDDRPQNVTRALRHHFRALEYSMNGTFNFFERVAQYEHKE